MGHRTTKRGGRTARLELRLTPEEREAFDELGARLGVGACGLVRMAAIEFCRARGLDPAALSAEGGQ